MKFERLYFSFERTVFQEIKIIESDEICQGSLCAPPCKQSETFTKKTNTIKSKELNDYISITIKFTLGNVGGIHTDC
jgi:hypothetical protein